MKSLRTWTRLGLILALFLSVPATALIAYAHAVLVRAEPAPYSVLASPPQSVSVWASEPLNPSYSSLRVFDSSRNPVDLGDSRVDSRDRNRLEVGLKPLAPGRYTVVYTLNSRVDGHTTQGNYTFAVGSLGETPTPGGPVAPPAGGPGETRDTGGITWSSPRVVQTAAHWALLLFAVLLTGGVITGIALPRLLKAEAAESWRAAMAEGAAARWHQAGHWLALLLWLAALASIVALNASALGGWQDALSPSSLWKFLASSRFGIVTLAKLASSSFVVFMAFTGRLKAGPSLLVLLELLVLTAYTSHAASVTPFPALAIGMDFLHLLGVSVWVGGMGFFALTMLPPSSEKHARAWQRLARVLPGFSPLAAASVALIVGSGAYGAFTRLSEPGDLLATPFGRVLVVKLVVVVFMLILSFVHVFLIRPRLSLSVKSFDQSQRLFAVWLRRILRLESLVAVVIVALTAVMAAYPPPRLVATAAAGAAGPPGAPPAVEAVRMSLARRAADLLVVADVGPGKAGPNRVQVKLLSAATGRPVQTPALVRLRATYLSQPSGGQFVAAERAPDGTYLGSVDFFFEGAWSLEVVVRREGVRDASADFTLSIAANDASALLARAQAAMNGLTSMRMREEVDDGTGGISVRLAEFQAPDRSHTTRDSGEEEYRIGTSRLKREGKTEPWVENRTPPFAWPAFDFRSGWAYQVIVGSERLDGQPHSVVAAFEAGAGVHHLLWIGTDDNLVRRWERTAPGSFLEATFSDFNSKDIAIARPP